MTVEAARSVFVYSVPACSSFAFASSMVLHSRFARAALYAAVAVPEVVPEIVPENVPEIVPEIVPEAAPAVDPPVDPEAA